MSGPKFLQSAPHGTCIKGGTESECKSFQRYLKKFRTGDLRPTKRLRTRTASSRANSSTGGTASMGNVDWNPLLQGITTGQGLGRFVDSEHNATARSTAAGASIAPPYIHNGMTTCTLSFEKKNGSAQRATVFYPMDFEGNAEDATLLDAMKRADRSNTHIFVSQKMILQMNVSGGTTITFNPIDWRTRKIKDLLRVGGVTSNLVFEVSDTLDKDINEESAGVRFLQEESDSSTDNLSADER
jgi:hypothetical protein